MLLLCCWLTRHPTCKTNQKQCCFFFTTRTRPLQSSWFYSLASSTRLPVALSRTKIVIKVGWVDRSALCCVLADTRLQNHGSFTEPSSIDFTGVLRTTPARVSVICRMSSEQLDDERGRRQAPACISRAHGRRYRRRHFRHECPFRFRLVVSSSRTRAVRFCRCYCFHF